LLELRSLEIIGGTPDLFTLTSAFFSDINKLTKNLIFSDYVSGLKKCQKTFYSRLLRVQIITSMKC